MRPIGHDVAGFGKVPEELHRVSGATLKLIRDRERTACAPEGDLPNMSNGIGEAPVAVMSADDPALPLAHIGSDVAGVSMLEPHEIAARLGLVTTIHRQGVMGTGAPEVVAPALFRVIGIRPGIDQELADRRSTAGSPTHPHDRARRC